MADDLTLKGNIDIAVGDATRNLSNLEASLGRITRIQSEFNEISTAQARVSRTVASAVKDQSAAVLNLAKAHTEANKAAAIAADAQSRQQNAVAKAAEDSARRQAVSAKTANAAAAQNVARKVTNTSDLAKPTGASYVSNNLNAALGEQNNSALAEMRKYYAAQQAMGEASARTEFASRTQFAQQSFNAELKARQVELTQMRGDAEAAFKGLSPKIDLDDIGQLNQLRYQLYDIATAAGVMGGALVASAGYAVKTASDYEAAFTTVARTVNKPVSAIDDLKQGLLEMSETIPVSTTDLASVEALGAQLGIADSSLNKFTETTAKYAAVSGVSNEQVANSFGAIFNLTGTGAGEFDKLASSINYVGINSVATDSEILKLTQEISASTTQAGFAADQTVGFAAALASLRIQPEQARGVVLRLFSDIDKAVSVGGDSLDAYANQLGITSDAAAKLWKTEPEQFLNSLIKTLSTAKDVNGAIRDLGVKETRETNVLQRLAGNYDIYTKSMGDASSAYKEGTFLADSYAKTQDTLASRLQILQNTLQNLAARFGESLGAGLKPIISFLSVILSAISSIPAPFFTVITVVTALIGVFALLVAAGAGLLGTMLAIAAALKGFKAVTGTSTLSFATLANVIRQLAVEMGLGSAASRIMSASLTNLKGSTDRTTASTAASVVATDAAAVANRGFAASARSVGTSLLGIPFINIIAALSIAVPLVISFAQAMGNVKNRNAELAQSLLDASGGIDSFSQALAKDTADAAGHTKGLRTVKVGLDDLQKSEEAAGKTAASRASTVQQTLGISDASDSSNRKVTDGLREQTLVIGENGKAWVSNALAQQAMQDQNSAIYKFFNDPKQQEVARQYGINIQQAIADGIGTKGGVQAALEAQFKAAESAGAVGNGATDDAATIKRTVAFEAMKKSLTEAGGSVDGLSDKLRVQSGIQQALGIDTDATSDAIENQTNKAGELGDSFQAQLSASSNYATALYAMQQSLEENGDTFDQWSTAGISNITALQNTLNAAVTAGNGMGMSAADSMISSLGSIDVSTDQIKSIVNTLAAANPTMFAHMNIDEIIAKAQQVQKILKGAGFTTKASLGKDVLAAQQAKLSQLLSQRDAQQSQLRNKQQSAADSGNTGQKAAPKKAKEVKAPELKTAAEYASDLGAAMDDAFKNRFGIQQAVDNISSKFADMRDRIKEARDQIRSIKTDLQKLASDRNILQIQLKVALDYGDDTRAQAIRAELAQNASDTAKKQTTLADAIAGASVQLEGNTKAARDNRAAVIDLLGSYKDQIQAFADTGASSEEVREYARKLRGEFIKQLTQLGYNRDSVLRYAGTFDSLSDAVSRVPTHKDVKVTADVSQAMGGLNAVGSRIASLGGDISNLNGQIDATKDAIGKQQRANAINKQISDLQGQKFVLLSGPGSGARKKSIDQQIATLNAKLASGNFARGGVVGGGTGKSVSKYADDITANLKIGEGVVTVDGMKMLGANGLNAINGQQNPFPPVVVNSQNANNSGTLVVELSPIDRQLLAQGKNVSVMIGRDEIARQTNAANLNTANRGANG